MSYSPLSTSSSSGVTSCPPTRPTVVCWKGVSDHCRSGRVFRSCYSPCNSASIRNPCVPYRTHTRSKFHTTCTYVGSSFLASRFHPPIQALYRHDEMRGIPLSAQVLATVTHTRAFTFHLGTYLSAADGITMSIVVGMSPMIDQHYWRILAIISAP